MVHLFDHVLWNLQFINCQQELDTSFCTRWDSLYLVSQSMILTVCMYVAETTLGNATLNKLYSITKELHFHTYILIFRFLPAFTHFELLIRLCIFFSVIWENIYILSTNSWLVTPTLYPNSFKDLLSGFICINSPGIYFAVLYNVVTLQSLRCV